MFITDCSFSQERNCFSARTSYLHQRERPFQTHTDAECVSVCDDARLPSSSSPPSVVGSVSGSFGLMETFHTQT